LVASCLPQDRIDKDRIGKVSIGEDNICQKIVDLYNEHCPSLPKVIKLTEVRKRAIHARMKTYSEDDLVKVFDKAEASDFLRNGSGTWHGASFDWIMNPSNLVKILKGNYDNRPAKDDAAAELDESYEMMRRWSES
jgi:ethanolamine utilization protein EutQ (cupin superfamily)